MKRPTDNSAIAQDAQPVVCTPDKRHTATQPVERSENDTGGTRRKAATDAIHERQGQARGEHVRNCNQ
jgi:hypothetical protein